MKNIHDIKRSKLQKDVIILIILDPKLQLSKIPIINKTNSINRIISKENI